MLPLFPALKFEARSILQSAAIDLTTKDAAHPTKAQILTFTWLNPPYIVSKTHVLLRRKVWYRKIWNWNLTFRGPCFVIYSYNKIQQDAIFLNFILVKTSTCFGQIYCPSSGSLDTVFEVRHPLCVKQYNLISRLWWTRSRHRYRFHMHTVKLSSK